MASFVVLDVGRPTAVEATIVGDGIWIGPGGVEAALGWELKPEGLCRDDLCIPVAGFPGLVRDGELHLEALADLLERPLAVSVEDGVAYVGQPLALYDQTVGKLRAPDFSLPDLDGRIHLLSDYRGSKVLLAAWASW